MEAGSIKTEEEETSMPGCGVATSTEDEEETGDKVEEVAGRLEEEKDEEDGEVALNAGEDEGDNVCC